MWMLFKWLPVSAANSIQRNPIPVWDFDGIRTEGISAGRAIPGKTFHWVEAAAKANNIKWASGGRFFWSNGLGVKLHITFKVSLALMDLVLLLWIATRLRSTGDLHTQPQHGLIQPQKEVCPPPIGITSTLAFNSCQLCLQSKQLILLIIFWPALSRIWWCSREPATLQGYRCLPMRLLVSHQPNQDICAWTNIAKPAQTFHSFLTS